MCFCVGANLNLLCCLLQLLDLCVMDISSLDFSYSILAAAAFCHFSTFDVVHKVSGNGLFHFGLFIRFVWYWFLTGATVPLPLPIFVHLENFSQIDFLL